jgi:putative flippase GtrA
MNKLKQEKKDLMVKKEVRHASYYLIIGLSAMAIDVGIFYLLNKRLSVFAIFANTISVTTATFFGFFVNQKYNFKVNNSLFKRFISYAMVSVLGLILGNLFIYLMNSVYGYDAFLAKLVSLPIIVGLQYLVNRLVSFNKKIFVDKIKQ